MIASFPSETVLTALLEAMDHASLGCSIVLEKDGVLQRVYANAALGMIHRRTPEELLALPPLDVLAARERAKIDALRQLGPRLAEPFETAIVRGDGTEVPVVVALGFATLEGAPATFVFVRDVSAQAKIEAALRESEERFRLLADACPDSITMSIDARYTYANPTALRLLGLSSIEDLATFDPWSTVSEHARSYVIERVERLKRGEKVPTSLMRSNVRGRELAFETSLSLAPVGGKEAILSYSRDVTERLRLQAELMKQDRLASVGTLAAGVAHELNNPLGALAMQAKRLHEDGAKLGLPDEVRASLAQIDEAATRMRAIITDLLSLARPVDRPQAHVDVAQILRSTISLLSAGTPTPLVVRSEIDSLPPVSAYPSKLGQVFLNLLRNAVQAIEGRPGGEVVVRASAKGEGIEIAVVDNGAGVPRELLGRIAQPFFTTKPTGTGLGLWISQELVQQHSGTIDFASEEGKGTTVTVRLPIESA